MNKFLKIVIGFTMALAMVVGVGASTASAYTSYAQMNVDTGGFRFNTNLSLGMRHPDVAMLQRFLNIDPATMLNGTGTIVGHSGYETSYFGVKTQAATKLFQAKYASEVLAPVGLNGANPRPTGYFGPMSRAKANALLASGTVVVGPFPSGCTSFSGYSTTTGMPCSGPSFPAGCTSTAGYSTTTGQPCSGSNLPAGCTSTAGYSPTTGVKCDSSTTTTTPPSALAGTDGSISDVNMLSQYNNEEVGEGQEDIKVLGMDVEASTDGDIEIKSIKVNFDATGNTGSDNLDDYIQKVTIWQGSSEVGSADVNDFSEGASGVFTKTITLNAGSIVRADTIQKFYISVDANENLDSGDITGDSWTVDVDNIRFIDGSGVVTTDDSTGDINAMNVPINFVDFSTASNTELVITTDSNTPDQGIVIVDDTDVTDDVVLLKGKLKLNGTSDAVLDELPITLTSSTLVQNVTGSVTLSIGGETFSESVTINALTGTVTFDNLDFAIDAGETVNFTVMADINDMDDGNTFDEGETLEADLTATNRDYIDIENEQGEQFADSTEKSGTANGEVQEFRTTGIMLTWIGSTFSNAAGQNPSDDQGTFTLKFSAKAIGDTIYISSASDITLSGVTVGKTSVNVDRAGTGTTGGTSVVLENKTNTAMNSVGLFQLDEGEENTFWITTTVTLPAAGAGGSYRVSLAGMSWDTDSTDGTPDNAYTSNLDQFNSGYQGLN